MVLIGTGTTQLIGAAGRMCSNTSDVSETLRTFSWKNECRPVWEKVRITGKVIRKLSQLMNPAGGMNNSGKRHSELHSCLTHPAQNHNYSIRPKTVIIRCSVMLCTTEREAKCCQ